MAIEGPPRPFDRSKPLIKILRGICLPAHPGAPATPARAKRRHGGLGAEEPPPGVPRPERDGESVLVRAIRNWEDRDGRSLYIPERGTGTDDAMRALTETPIDRDRVDSGAAGERGRGFALNLDFSARRFWAALVILLSVW